MNLIILFPEDFTDLNQVRLTDRRLEHIVKIQKVTLGQTLNIGTLNGNMGVGEITSISTSAIEMTVCLDQPPPKPLPVTLILALPRPKMLKRILETITAMGVKKLYLINSYRVEKSYWQTPLLADKKIREHCVLGLEQSKDTVLPEVVLRKRFKPFVEDELPAIADNTRPLVAHPGPYPHCPHRISEPVTLIVGPEGGLVSYEVEKLQSCGFSPISLGPRILRVETAIPILLAKLF